MVQRRGYIIMASEYIKIFFALLAVANPVGIIPLFISMTGGMSKPAVNHTARKASLTVAVVMVASVFAGAALLGFFGIRIPAFRVAGGILVMMTAMHMLSARVGPTRHTPEEDREAVEKEDVSIVPLGIPLIAGPGTISTVIMYADKAKTWVDTLALTACGVLVALAVYATLRLAEPISRLLGRTGVNIITRVMGLILAAVAIEFLAGGLGELFPGWLRHR